MTVASALGDRAGRRPGHRPGVRRRARPRPRRCRSPRWPSSGSPCSRRPGSWRGGWAPASCSTACRRATAAGSPGSTCACRSSWHQRHPTGQLLSNANADVEATWFPIAPLPMAVGVLVMLVVAGVALVLTDLVLALIGFLVFPAIFVLNVVYQRRLSPLATRAQQLRAEVSGVAHESLRRRAGREDARPGAGGDRAVPGRGARSCATPRSRSAGSAGMFDPALEALPSLAVLAVLLVGAAADGVRRARRRRAGAGRLPVHPARVPGAGHRLGARGAAAQRGRLGPGVATSWPRRAG